MPMARKDNNQSDNFGFHKDKKPILEGLDIEEDDINLASKSLDTGSYIRNILLRRILWAGLLGSELSSFLREIKFSNEGIAASTSVFNIRYNQLRFQNNNLFYLFYD